MKEKCTKPYVQTAKKNVKCRSSRAAINLCTAGNDRRSIGGIDINEKIYILSFLEQRGLGR